MNRTDYYAGSRPRYRRSSLPAPPRVIEIVGWMIENIEEAILGGEMAFECSLDAEEFEDLKRFIHRQQKRRWGY